MVAIAARRLAFVSRALAFIAANNKLQLKFLRGMRAAWAHFAQANYRSARSGSFFQLLRLFFPGIAHQTLCTA